MCISVWGIELSTPLSLPPATQQLEPTTTMPCDTDPCPRPSLSRRHYFRQEAVWSYSGEISPWTAQASLSPASAACWGPSTGRPFRRRHERWRRRRETVGRRSGARTQQPNGPKLPTGWVWDGRRVSDRNVRGAIQPCNGVDAVGFVRSFAHRVK